MFWQVFRSFCIVLARLISSIGQRVLVYISFPSVHTATMAPTIGIIAAEFNPEIVEPMVEAAQQELEAAGISVDHIIRVPGSYEIPLAADMLLKKGGLDALVVLGYIERGETLHGEVMGHVVHRSIVEMQIKYSIPIAIGIIGPGATIEQALSRNRDYAIGAARCALQMIAVVNSIVIQ